MKGTDSMINKKFASILPLSAGILWGLTGLFVRRLDDIGIKNTIHLAFFRSAFSAIGLIIYLFLKDKKQLKIKPRDIWCFFGTGILSVLAFSVCYFYTLTHASIAVAVVLSYTAPFFVMILSAILFKEKITLAKVLALFMAMAGCVLLCKTDKNTPITPLIITVGVLSGLAYALYSIFARFVVGKYPPLVITAYTFAFTALGSIFLIDLREFGSAISNAPSCIFILVAFTAVSTLMPYVLLTIGLKYIEPGKAAILTTTEVLTASICGVLFSTDTIGTAGIFGIILLIAGVILVNTGSVSKKL